MSPRILSRIRRPVLGQQYIVTIHADDEMSADDLTVQDLERIVLTGEIVERQRDASTSEYKYTIRGRDLEGSAAEVIARISTTGKVVFIAVYSF